MMVIVRLLVFWVGWALLEVASLKAARAGLFTSWFLAFTETGYIVVGSIYLAMVKP